MSEERRVVTVVFADVVGSTRLGEELDAEEVRSLLAAYYEIARDVVATHGGTLEKFIGDAVMGVFGMPQAHGDDAERALSAAIQLRERVRADETLVDLRLRFGVCTGEVVATRHPGADFLVTGDAVNVAARLQQVAEPWSILAAERTLSAVSAIFEVGPPLAIEVKGKTAAIAAREVLAKGVAPKGIRVAKAAMRGRDDELEQLTITGRRAFRDKRPAFVAIIAPAGNGKTRLLEEFLTREVPLLAPRRLVALAQCLPYGTQLTYWPLRQVLFALVGLEPEAGPAILQERLAAWLQNPRYTDLLATSIGFGSGEATDRSDVFAAWRFALEKASAEQPLVLVFEDLHWSSESLLDLVDHVMQSHADAPVLMLALSRPELLDRRPAWGGGRRNFSNVFLEPLSPEDIGALVRDLLPGAEDNAVRAVVSRAGGNPFYAEQLVRSVGAGEAPDALPDTVQANIQARLDLLPAEELRVLQVGSIFGRSFGVSGVRAIAPDLAQDVDALIEGLLSRDVLTVDERDRLTFSHILIREVAYQMLTRAERARLHAAAGAWLEAGAGGIERSLAELIAFHFREAVALLGKPRVITPEHDALKRRAVRWLALAGEMAAAGGAHLEASRHLRAAIEVAPAEDLPELYERLGDVEQLMVGSIDAYLTALELGREQARPAADELRVLGGLLTCAMRWAEGTGRFAPGVVDRMLEEGRALALQVRDARSLARFRASESFYPFHVSREGGVVTGEMITAAEASAREASELAAGIEDWNTWSAATDGLASCLFERAEWKAARDVARQRIERAGQLAVLERMDAHHMVALASVLLGDLVEAESVTKAGLHLLDNAQHPSLIQGLLGDRMYPLLLLGRWDEAMDLAAPLLRVWGESHEALGPGRMGFLVGLDIVRARRQTARQGEFRDALVEIAGHSSGGSHLLAYAAQDPAAIEREIGAALKTAWGRADVVERMLSALNDQGHLFAASTLDFVEEFAEHWHAPLVRAQSLRARHQFELAAALWAGMGARPLEARARIELAASQGVEPPPESVRLLEQLGDIQYLEAHDLRG